MFLWTRNLDSYKQSAIPSLGLLNASKYNGTGGNATEIHHQSLLLIHISGKEQSINICNFVELNSNLSQS